MYYQRLKAFKINHLPLSLYRKIEKEIKHTGNNLVLEFDTNMKNKDPCKASYAIDDIMIYYQWAHLCVWNEFICDVLYTPMCNKGTTIIKSFFH